MLFIVIIVLVDSKLLFGGGIVIFCVLLNFVRWFLSFIIKCFVVFLFIFGKLMSVEIFLFCIFVKNWFVDILDKIVRFNFGFILLVLINFWKSFFFILLVKLNSNWVFL